MELFCKDVKVWVPDALQVWKSATIRQDYKEGDTFLKVKDENNEELTIKIDKPDDLPPLRNPEILLGANDLTDLSYLNEPEVLYNLKLRFENNNLIYTYCGIVLVAINPYEELPIYGEDSVYAYRGADLTSLNPHIFAMAEQALKQMERENQDQSLIVSGESGAGKTVSAKYAMRYFAMVASSSGSCNTKLESHVEEKVLASNPIMEAIGNAKTTRNDNSSRFGKFIEIDFTKDYKMMGANMRTYLLEKSRVVFQSPQERNYHIFYQLCSARNDPAFENLKLMHQDEFAYTCGGECPEIDNVDDLKEFESTRNAFRLLDFSSSLQMELFSILAAVLHLGNVDISEAIVNNTDGSRISSADPHLEIVADLMGVDANKLSQWLCNRSVLSGKDNIITPLNKSQAIAARNALAKHIYAQIFDYIVSYINKSLATSAKQHRFIGVLDIYGFETFEVNSFEQFCINYANEKLQQQFNLHVFKLEQEEYKREEINWEYINFFDNQPCIDLIESKLGILDLLDEECRLPRGADDNWCKKLYDKCSGSKHFDKPKFFDKSFIVCHFADTVKYLATGFLDKNKDTVLEEQINILRCSQVGLLKSIFTDEPRKVKLKVTPGMSSTPASSKKNKKTVGLQFRESLTLLMETLNKTTPSYIRCIKPNDAKSAFEFDSFRAIQQLRACGVLETVRISAAGFPTRWTYAQFLARYRVLVKSGQVHRQDPKVTCQTIVQDIMKPDKYQFGRTKVFFRSGQLAYMEKIRGEKLRKCAIMITKYVKGWLYRTRYRRVRHAVLMIQCFARGQKARQYARHLRETRAAVSIQKYVRMYLCHKRYLNMRMAAIVVQKYARGWSARRHVQRIRLDQKVTLIQKNVRCWLAKKKYRHTLRAIVTIQSYFRGTMARRAAKPLREERKQSNYLKEENRRIREHSEYLGKLNRGLENKIIQLQQRLDEQIGINKTLENIEKEHKESLNQLKRFRKMEIEIKDTLSKKNALEIQINAFKGDLEKERAEKMDILMEKELLEKSSNEKILLFTEENKKLKNDLNELRKQQSLQATEAEELSKRLHEKDMVIQDSDEDRGQYQKLLAEKNQLEMLVEELQEKNHKLSGLGKGHRRAPSDTSNYSEATTDIIRDDTSDFSGLTLDYASMNDEDLGYSSTRRGPRTERKDLQAWLNKSEGLELEDKSLQPIDIQFVLKLQQKLKDSDREKVELRRKLDRLEHRSTSSPDLDEGEEDYNLIRLQESELEIVKLRNQLQELRDSTANNTGHQALISQFESLSEEVERRREEVIQLRASIARRTTKAQVNYHCENNDFENAFHAQKDINKQLEMELQTEKEASMKRKQELDLLKEDNDRQMRLLGQQLAECPKSEIEQRFQIVFARITKDNMDLSDRCNMLEDQNRKLKIQLKKFYKQIKETQALEARKEVSSLNNQLANKGMPAIKLKKHDYMGMFEYPDGGEEDVVRGIIIDLKPRVARELVPGLAAYIFFMCIRYTDHINDDTKIRNLLSSGIVAIKKVVKRKHGDMETMVLWLANTCRLLHTFKQYSDEQRFKELNTAKQNEQCLRNFDLSEYRQVLSDIAVWIYQGLIKILEEKIHLMVVPAILENEGASMMSDQDLFSGRSRSQSTSTDPGSPEKKENHLTLLLNELGLFLAVFHKFGIDPQTVGQIFRQVYYFICAVSLNNLFLRKNLCRWSKGLQIRFNISCLEQWCRDSKLQDPEPILNTLKPIIEASQLLQARKTKEDIKDICELCTRLTPLQIIKILSLYTPCFDYDDTIPDGFVKEVKAYLDKKSENSDSSKELLMDTKYAFPINFPFNPSGMQLETIEIPDCLNLPMLKKM